MAKKNVLLIHDWDYKKYSKLTDSNDYWKDHPAFLFELDNYFNVYKLNLPGFCHQAEPTAKTWYLDDYVEYLEKYIRNKYMALDYIIGCGFGGSIALYWKVKYKKRIKIVLLSTNLFKSDKQKTFNLKAPGLLGSLTKKIEKSQAINSLKMEEVINGTEFLQNTYLTINNMDLLPQLLKINPEDITLIYGDNDSEVNILTLFNTLPITYRPKLGLIPNSDKNIIVNNPTAVVKNIVDINNIFIN